MEGCISIRVYRSCVIRLLIAYDGSPGADAALDDLGRAGLPARCDAIVLCVEGSYLPPEPSTVDASLRTEYDHLHREALAQVKRCREQSQRAADRLKQVFPSWAIQAEAAADSPGWGVICRAEGWGGASRADLIIIGATGKSAIGRVLLGSVSHKVVTYARCSVRVARFTAASKDRNLRLVVGVDGSPDALTAVQAICSRNWPPGTEVHVVCAVDSRMIASQPGVSSVDGAAEAIALRAADELRGVGLAVFTHVTKGEPKQELLKQAEETAADCLFVGARGWSRVERILLGSVSTAVAMRAPCSVEVVRPPTT